MTLSEIYNCLLTTGLPVVYHSWKAENKEPPEPPYIVYFFIDSENIGADNKVYYKSNRYQVELYTNKKDLSAEQALENVLDGAGIFYDKTEVYIESEKMYQIIYEI